MPLGTSVSPRPSPRRRRALNPLPPEWPSSRITPCSSVFWSNRLPGANGELLLYLQFLDLMTLLFLQCCSLCREDFGTFGTYKIPDCVCNYVCEWMEVLYTTQWMLVFLCMCLHKHNICIYIYIYIYIIVFIYIHVPGLRYPQPLVSSCCVNDGDIMMFMEQGAGVPGVLLNIL